MVNAKNIPKIKQVKTPPSFVVWTGLLFDESEMGKPKISIFRKNLAACFALFKIIFWEVFYYFNDFKLFIFLN